MGKLKDYKSKQPEIIGHSTINHAARVRLGLNCSEYVFIEFLDNAAATGGKSDPLTIYIKTGFTEKDAGIMIKSLIAKAFLFIENDTLKVSNKWKDAFASLDREFDNLFWQKDGKVCWTGTKKKALEYYIKLRKRLTLDYLVKQRDCYFEFLDLQRKYRNFDQQKLMCQVFLNPANERFAEDYASYCADLNKKYGKPEKVDSKPLTREEVNKAYE